MQAEHFMVCFFFVCVFGITLEHGDGIFLLFIYGKGVAFICKIHLFSYHAKLFQTLNKLVGSVRNWIPIYALDK